MLKQKQHSPDEYDRNETYDDPGIHDHQIGHNYHLDSLPSGDYAFDAWPPSIYEAVQYAYPGSLPYRQPTNIAFELTVHPAEKSWEESRVALPSQQERSRDFESLQVDSMNQAYCEQNLITNDRGSGSSSAIDDAGPSAPCHGKGHRCAKPKAAR